MVKFSFIQVYAPQSGKPTQVKMVCSKATGHCRYYKMKDKLIVSGDFNDHIGRERNNIKYIMNAFSIGDKNVGAKQMIDFSLTNGLAALNTFYEFRKSQK